MLGAQASARPDHAAAGRHRASHHPQLRRGQAAMSFAERAAPKHAAPRILCAGIIVLDEVFRVEEFPQPDGKVQAKGFFVVNGGCAANAAVAIARLGGRAALAGPMGGPAGEDAQRRPRARRRSRARMSTAAPVSASTGLSTALSAIFINARGDRTIVTYRDERIAATVPADPRSASSPRADAVLADNRYPAFRRGRSARRRAAAACRSCSTATGRRSRTIRCFASPRTSFFPPNACARRPASPISATGLQRIARNTDAFLAVSNGPDDIVYLDGGALRRLPVFEIARWIRSAPATLCTAASRWRWPKGEARSRPCASAPRSPASNAAGSAAPPARRRARRSRRFWPRTRIQMPLIPRVPVSRKEPARSGRP